MNISMKMIDVGSDVSGVFRSFDKFTENSKHFANCSTCRKPKARVQGLDAEREENDGAATIDANCVPLAANGNPAYCQKNFALNTETKLAKFIQTPINYFVITINFKQH